VPDSRFAHLDYRALNSTVHLELEPILTNPEFYKQCNKCGFVSVLAKKVIDSADNRGLIFRQHPTLNPGFVVLPGARFSVVTDRLREELEQDEPGVYDFQYVGVVLD